MRNKKLNTAAKINVIPVLDAVFIFIFFLLMSAQFIDFYEIGSSNPVFKDEVSDQQDKNKSKNFKLKVYNSKIVVTEGATESILKTFGTSDQDIDSLKKYLVQLKSKHPKEKSIVIKPKRSVKYQDVIKVVDVAQHRVLFNHTNTKLFFNIAFEEMD